MSRDWNRSPGSDVPRLSTRALLCLEEPAKRSKKADCSQGGDSKGDWWVRDRKKVQAKMFRGEEEEMVHCVKHC